MVTFVIFSYTILLSTFTLCFSPMERLLPVVLVAYPPVDDTVFPTKQIHIILIHRAGLPSTIHAVNYLPVVFSLLVRCSAYSPSACANPG